MHLPFSTDSLQTPCYVTDVAALKRNGEILKSVQQETGCKILLAQKAFSMFATYPILNPYLSGTGFSGNLCHQRPYCIQFVSSVAAAQGIRAVLRQTDFLWHPHQSGVCRSGNRFV